MEEKLVLVRTLLLDVSGNEDALHKHSGAIGFIHLWWVAFWRWVRNGFHGLCVSPTPCVLPSAPSSVNGSVSVNIVLLSDFMD